MENPVKPYIAFQVSLNALFKGENVELITYRDAVPAMHYSEILITEWLGKEYSYDNVVGCYLHDLIHKKHPPPTTKGVSYSHIMDYG